MKSLNTIAAFWIVISTNLCASPGVLHPFKHHSEHHDCPNATTKFLHNTILLLVNVTCAEFCTHNDLIGNYNGCMKTCENTLKKEIAAMGCSMTQMDSTKKLTIKPTPKQPICPMPNYFSQIMNKKIRSSRSKNYRLQQPRKH